MMKFSFEYSKLKEGPPHLNVNYIKQKVNKRFDVYNTWKLLINHTVDRA